MATAKTSILLPAGKRLTVTAGSDTSGTFQLINSGSQQTPVEVKPSNTRYVQPSSQPRQYEIISATGQLAVSIDDVSDTVQEFGGSLNGLCGNLTVIDDGQELVLRENAQAQVFVEMTVNGSLTVNGELRVGAAWPT